MTELIRCKNCGAMMKPQADGRTRACEHCGAQVQLAVDSEQIAAGLKLDLSNVDHFLSQLARALHGSLVERTKLQLEGEKVISFEVNLDPDVFVVLRERTGVIARHKKMVRGIALKTVTHPVDKWVALLSKALASHANENARVAQILNQLRGG
jgi:hypothetical protein